MDHSTRLFIIEHIQEDVRQLALQGKKYPSVDIPFAVNQISSCQKVKDKIPTFYKPGILLYPQGLSVEQSSSELTAKFKSTFVSGELLIDLTGGFGVDFYFLSQKFKKSIYIERQKELCNIAEHNFKNLGLDSFEIFQGDVTKILNEIPYHADWIFVDPHRRSDTGRKVFRLVDCEPDLTKMQDLLHQKAKNVLLKLSPMLDISAAISDLYGVTDVFVVSVENECKEILIKISGSNDTDVRIICVNLLKNADNQLFEYYFESEKQADNRIASSYGKYLYEPNASVLKSGAFKIITQKFPVNKLHIHTHLYSSDEYLPTFPGKVFEIREIYRFEKKHLIKLVEDYPKANIISRNFILSVDEFRKKTGIKEGGETFLFLCKDFSLKNIILVCQKNKGF